MAVIFVERIPLPNLSNYVFLSIILLSAALIHIQRYDSHEFDDDDFEIQPLKTSADPINTSKPKLWYIPDNQTSENPNYTASVTNLPFIDRFSQETWCMWSLINIAYCILIILGKVIQNVVFGELRLAEHQYVREKFWNFVFYKFIFIFGVLNVQTLEEVLLWIGWFSILGFLHLLTALAKARFEYLTFSPSSTVSHYLKLILLLSLLIGGCGPLTGLSLFLGLHHSSHVMCFMLAEVLLLAIVTLHVLLHCVIHLYNCQQDTSGTENHSEGASVPRVMSQVRGAVAYYVDLCLDTALLSVDMIHHLHMLVWSNIFLSMASLVVFMQLRYLYYELSKRVQRHRKYCHLVTLMRREFPLQEVTGENCAICWELVVTCRQLPCNHIFHETCLRSWLEQDPSCPACRATLGPLQPPPAPQSTQQGQGDEETTDVHQMSPTGTAADIRPAARSRFFHFNGSRYLSWLPTFHIEVSQMSGISPTVSGSHPELVESVEHVQSIFPHVPVDVIINDLRRTGNTEDTVNNILEGNLTLHAPQLPAGPMQMHLDLHTEDLPPINQRVDDFDVPSSALPTSSDASIPDDLHSSGVDNDSDQANWGSGVRFSKSPRERESILADRKRQMMQQAKKRFVVHDTTPHSNAPKSCPSYIS